MDNPSCETVMENKEKDDRPEWQDDDRVIYVPDELYHSFYRALFNMEQAQAELRKIREGMNTPENEES
jgi:hypothetical protein